MATRSRKKVLSARLGAARKAAEVEVLQNRLSKHHAPTLTASTAAGAAAGVMAGAFGGPLGAAVGGFVGAAIGAVAGEALEESTEEHDTHDAQLDVAIGVDGGDIGARGRT